MILFVERHSHDAMHAAGKHLGLFKKFLFNDFQN